MKTLSDAFKLAWSEYLKRVKEVQGVKSNVNVIGYFTDVGHKWVKNDETAWCAAFVGSCLERAGIASTKALNARSYLTWGKSTTTPKRGDIVVLSRGSNQSEGHVAFYYGTSLQNKDIIILLGGNQSDRVKLSPYKKSSVLGYRTL